MTSAYLTELRRRLGVSRDRLYEELRNVPVDHIKTAIYERQIAHLLEEMKLCSTSEDLGKVVFGVTAEHGDFKILSLSFPHATIKSFWRPLRNGLGWHKPPLRLKTVNNVTAIARPGNMILAVDFQDGDRLEAVADIAPGHAYFDAYPRPYQGFTKGLLWSWTQQ